ncbi:MAG: hypothetical protein FJY85_04800 [Deltaproteobacteria bacterium]|nr:hypothetical protein [Deltaproteobacteria bacterium]
MSNELHPVHHLTTVVVVDETGVTGALPSQPSRLSRTANCSFPVQVILVGRDLFGIRLYYSEIQPDDERATP